MVSCLNLTKIGRNPTFLRIPKVTQKQANSHKGYIKKRKELFLNLSVCMIPNKKCELCKAVALKIEHALKSPGRLVRRQTAGPPP